MTCTLFAGSVYFDVEAYGQYNRFVPETQQQPDRESKAGGRIQICSTVKICKETANKVALPLNNA